MVKTIKNRMVNYKKIKSARVTVGILLPPYISNTSTNIKAYLDPTYIKWLSRAKAAVVPIMYNISKVKMREYLSQVNGILLTGGGIDNKISHSRKQFLEYQNSLIYIMRYAKKQNDIKHYYPIWATCMSFQLLAVLEIKKRLKRRNDKLLDNIPQFGLDNLYMKADLKHSRLGKIFSKKQIDMLRDNKSTYHKHFKSFYLNNEIIQQLKPKINIIATNKDDKKRDYLSIYEYKDYPFYAVLFHPEYPLVSKRRESLNVKRKEMLLLSDKLGKFFIDECKKNKNVVRTIHNKSINRYPVYEFTRKNKYNRVYYFKN